MAIMEIKGTQCSGKTWARETVKDNPNVIFFDLLDFYKEKGCIVNGEMNWDKFFDSLNDLSERLEFVISGAENKLLIIEHMDSQMVSRALEGKEVETLELITPEKEVVIERAEKKNVPVENALYLRDLYLENRKKACNSSLVTSEEARCIIELRAKEIFEK